MKYKIIGFTKFGDNQDWDCIAITETGKRILVDPYVGCAWEYDNRTALLNTWFETEREHWHPEFNVLMPGETDFKVVYEPEPRTFLHKVKRIFRQSLIK
jgi:hypothetical protein